MYQEFIEFLGDSSDFGILVPIAYMVLILLVFLFFYKVVKS